MRTLLFIDTETSGLDPRNDQLLEVAWATLDDPQVYSFIVPHNPARIDPEAAKINRYYERDLADPSKWASAGALQGFTSILKDVTLCGANVNFDAGFLAAHFAWREFDAPWHHRKLDIEAMAYGILGLDEVPGMKAIQEMLSEDGYDIPEPDHTAAGDVAALRAAYVALRSIRETDVHLTRIGQ